MSEYGEKVLREALIQDKLASSILYDYAPELESNVRVQLIINYFDQN